MQFSWMKYAIYVVSKATEKNYMSLDLLGYVYTTAKLLVYVALGYIWHYSNSLTYKHTHIHNTWWSVLCWFLLFFSKHWSFTEKKLSEKNDTNTPRPVDEFDVTQGFTSKAVHFFLYFLILHHKAGLILIVLYFLSEARTLGIPLEADHWAVKSGWSKSQGFFTAV